MALLEGVGDEVAALFGALLAAALLGLAWLSTRTAPGGGAEEEEEAGRRAARPAPPRDEAPPRPEGVGGAEAAEGAGRGGGEGASPPGGSSPSSSPLLLLRLKFLNETERLARVRPGDTVGALKRLYFPGQERLVRLIYQGQLLRDDGQTWAALQLTHNSVLHCHISQRRASPDLSAPAGAARSHPEAARPALNVGGLLVPLLALMLGALWYFQLQHRHAFTATATTCLAGLTLLVSFVALAAYRR